jgi:hypothetical protein
MKSCSACAQWPKLFEESWLWEKLAALELKQAGRLLRFNASGRQSAHVA